MTPTPSITVEKLAQQERVAHIRSVYRDQISRAQQGDEDAFDQLVETITLSLPSDLAESVREECAQRFRTDPMMAISMFIQLRAQLFEVQCLVRALLIPEPSSAASGVNGR